VGRRGFDDLGLAGFGARRGVGGDVDHGGQHLDAGLPVDGAMVDFGQQRHLVSVDAFDDVALPQGAGPIEWPLVDPGHVVGEGLTTPVARYGRRAKVVVEIEVLVADPVGLVEAERHLLQLLGEDGEQVKAGDQEIPVPAKGPGFWRRCRVADEQPADMADGVAGLDGQEPSVEAAQLFHDAHLPTTVNAAGVRRMTGPVDRSSAGGLGRLAADLEPRNPLGQDYAAMVEDGKIG